MLAIFVDADACPVKQEVYRVAKRYQLMVNLVSNSPMRLPDQHGVNLIVVDEQFDAADNWIVEHISRDDIVITADIPLASSCLKNDAQVLGPTGYEFTDANMGQALATRDLLSELRASGVMTGGPAPFEKRDRSRFLQRLDEMVQSIRRRNKMSPSCIKYDGG